MKKIDFDLIPTPSYIVDERLLENNLKLLKSVIDRTGCKILLAQKSCVIILYNLSLIHI